jgi:hypothetical protein
MTGIKWSDDFLEGLSPICCECGKSCWGCDGVIKLNEGKVAHFECYKKILGTFEDFIVNASMRCTECGDLCDACEDVKEVGVGMIMHGVCYEEVLRRSQQNTEPVPETAVAVRLQGEEKLSRRAISMRRHKELFGEHPKTLRRQRSPTNRSRQGRSATGSCNDGASVDAGGDDSRPGVAGDSGQAPGVA